MSLLLKDWEVAFPRKSDYVKPVNGKWYPVMIYSQYIRPGIDKGWGRGIIMSPPTVMAAVFIHSS